MVKDQKKREKKKKKNPSIWHIHVQSSIIHNSQKAEATQVSFNNECMNKTWYTHIRKYYSALKRKDISEFLLWHNRIGGFCIARTQVWSPDWYSGLKDPVLPNLWSRLQLQLRSDPWPGSSTCHWMVHLKIVKNGKYYLFLPHKK